MAAVSQRTVIVTIKGRVQGVSYRYWAEQTARRLSLCGWVRNTSEGSVEALFSGEADSVQLMITACHSGPRAASVADIKAVDVESTDIPDPFEIRY